MPWNTTPDALEAVPRPLTAMARDLTDGEAIAPHSHGRAQLVYASAGVMTVNTSDGAWLVPPERAVWMPAGVTHWIDCAGTVRMRTLYIAPDAAPALPATCRVVGVSALLRQLILRAVDMPSHYDEAGPDGRLVAVILDELADLPTAPLHLAMPRDPRLRRVAEHLLADPGSRESAAALAEIGGVSERTMARLFKQETGLGLAAWRQQARLMKAVAWLGAGRRVTDCALDLGYESTSAFIAMFRRALGVTPGQYFQDSDTRLTES